MGSTYDIGDRVRTTAKFTTSTGSTDYTDPTTVTFHYENPGGGVTTGSLNVGGGSTANENIFKSSTGQFYYDITTTGAGIYEYRWKGTGLVTAAGESWFNVRNLRVTT